MTDTIEVATGGQTAMLIDGLREQIERLTASLRITRERADNAEQHHREDIDLIGSTLLAEAGSRDWCNEYDEVVDALNRRLNVSLPVREQDYTVTVNVRLSISVTARDEDEARGQAADMVAEAERCLDGHAGVTAYPDDRYSYEIEQD